MDPRRSRLLAALVAALILAVPAAAQAAWFPADAIDGPSPDIVAFGGIDVAPQGSAAIVYLKRDAAIPHVFMARMVGGQWSPPERVDATVPEEAAQPVVSVGEEGQIVVAWASAGRVLATAAPGPGQAFGPPQILATGGARNPSVDIGINDVAYVAYTADGAGGADVRASRLNAGGWAQIGPLDVNPDQSAGEGAGRPRVAVSAEGFAVVVWGEGHADGRNRVYGRRLTGTAISAFPQEVSLPDFGGAPGGAADSPDIDIEEDGSFAWVAFRQDIGGVTRPLARRLVGSQFEAPTALDDGSGGASPRVSINGRGVGLAAASGPGGSVFGSLLQLDAFAPPARWDTAGSAADAQPVVASAANEDAGVVWLRTAADGSAVVVARHHPKQTTLIEEENVISQAGFGTAAPDGRLEMSTSRLGDMAVGFLQGGPTDRRVAVATYDRIAGAPYGLTTRHARRIRQPELMWKPGLELWGPQTFKLYLDNVEVGSTTFDRIKPPAPLADGAHKWYVTSTDRRGQVSTMTPRFVRVDTTKPRISVSTRRKGRVLRIRVRATDTRGSGVKLTSIDFGDHTALDVRRTVRHVYGHSGRFRLIVRAFDRAGNVARRTIRLRIH